MSFEFYKTRLRPPKGPEAMISENGRIRFNKPAIDQFFDGNYPKRVYLAFDRNNRRIGVLVTNDEVKDTFVAKIVNKTELSIPAKAFFKRFSIAIPKGGISSLKIKKEPHDEESLVVIQL